MNTALVVASGTGSRMGANIPKQYLKLKNKYILHYTLDIFGFMENIDNIVLVVAKDYFDYVNENIIDKLIYKDKIKIVEGGSTRFESVKNGLDCIQEGIILIHDGVRPFTTRKEIEDVLQAGIKYGAATLGTPVTDTIKRVKNQYIVENVNRQEIYSVQTPQVFQHKIIKDAYEKFFCKNDKIFPTDDTMMVESLGQQVYIVKGSYENIKITNPIDLEYGIAILNKRGDNICE